MEGPKFSISIHNNCWMALTEDRTALRLLGLIGLS